MSRNYNSESNYNCIFITQNSYALVHRFFYDIFNKENSYIIYVREKERGLIKKYREIIYYFGVFNFILLILKELRYFLKLSNALNKLKTVTVNDHSLNDKILMILQKQKVTRIIL